MEQPKQKGVLFFEILIVLFILSVVALPWITYLNRHDSNIVVADLNDFFQLKRVLLQQLEKGGRDYEIKYANKRIVVFKTYINEKCNKLTADLYEKDRLKYSLFAIIK